MRENRKRVQKKVDLLKMYGYDSRVCKDSNKEEVTPYDFFTRLRGFR